MYRHLAAVSVTYLLLLVITLGLMFPILLVVHNKRRGSIDSRIATLVASLSIGTPDPVSLTKRFLRSILLLVAAAIVAVVAASF